MSEILFNPLDQKLEAAIANVGVEAMMSRGNINHKGYVKAKAEMRDAIRSHIGALAPRVLAMCKKRNWSLHWTARGSYLHLESSELIEALRGKRGDPLCEAADVLLVLMSITENHGLKWEAVVAQTERTVKKLETREHYKGEERMNTEPGDDAIVS